MSPNTVGGDRQFVDQFESRKESLGTKTNESKMLNTRQIDTNSSFKSGESAPDPAADHVNLNVGGAVK